MLCSSLEVDRISVQHYIDADEIGLINAGPRPMRGRARRL